MPQDRATARSPADAGAPGTCRPSHAGPRERRRSFAEGRPSAPAWLFDASRMEVMPLEVDTGMVQLDSLHLDVAASLGSAEAFYAHLAERTDSEAAFLRRWKADIVVGDIPPLAFSAAASLVGLPASPWRASP